MAENSTSKAPAESDWDNYPVECREAFLGLTGKAQTASEACKRHFIYPAVDEILDHYLAYREMFGD